MLVYFILLGNVCFSRLCLGDTCLNLLENIDIPYDYFTLKTYLIHAHLLGEVFMGSIFFFMFVRESANFSWVQMF